MSLFHLSLLLVLFGTSAPSYAVLCPVQVEDKDSPSELLLGYASALGYLKDARDSIKPNASNGSEAILMYKFAGQNFDCADAAIEPFKSSKDDSIAKSAAGFGSAVSELKKLNQTSIDKIKAILDKTYESIPESVRAEADADEIIARKNANTLLPLSVSLAVHAAISDVPDKQGRLSTLKISKAERDLIIAKLKERFKLPIPATERLYVEYTVKTLHETLTQKGWKFRKPSKQD